MIDGHYIKRKDIMYIIECLCVSLIKQNVLQDLFERLSISPENLNDIKGVRIVFCVYLCIGKLIDSHRM